MASGAIHVTGYREVIAALGRVSNESRPVLIGALKEAAWPVASDSKSRLKRYQGISLQTITPRVSTRGVFVTQRAKKVTGRRGDFGALQMTKGLMPALEDNREETYLGVELAFAALIKKEGFS